MITLIAAAAKAVMAASLSLHARTAPSGICQIQCLNYSLYPDLRRRRRPGDGARAPMRPGGVQAAFKPALHLPSVPPCLQTQHRNSCGWWKVPGDQLVVSSARYVAITKHRTISRGPQLGVCVLYSTCTLYDFPMFALADTPSHTHKFPSIPTTGPLALRITGAQ
ncbi:hypothetical protein EDC01DRAFT_461708 [Geopyxis carbonaria]|nr:hypothetical protein EDC01DRAFT_461708 [Geopyxis carbonaria]